MKKSYFIPLLGLVVLGMLLFYQLELLPNVSIEINFPTQNNIKANEHGSNWKAVLEKLNFEDENEKHKLAKIEQILEKNFHHSKTSEVIELIHQLVRPQPALPPLLHRDGNDYDNNDDDYDNEERIIAMNEDEDGNFLTDDRLLEQLSSHIIQVIEEEFNIELKNHDTDGARDEADDGADDEVDDEANDEANDGANDGANDEANDGANDEANDGADDGADDEADDEANDGVDESSVMGFRVKLPSRINQCVSAEITFTATSLLASYLSSSDDPHRFRSNLFIQLKCSSEENDDIESDSITVSFTKLIPALPLHSSPFSYKASFYPDSGTEKCSVQAMSNSSDFRLIGEITEKSYLVQPTPFTLSACWHCYRSLYQDVPPASQFVLMDQNKNIFWGDHFRPLRLPSRSSFRMYVVAIEEVKERYRELTKDLQFNAFMSNDQIIQEVKVDYQYDEEYEGYRLDIETYDTGVFKLYVTLNWYWASSDVGDPDHPLPILSSSHIRHEYSSCDFTRSEIHSSQLLIHVYHHNDNDHDRNDNDDNYDDDDGGGEVNGPIMSASPKKCVSFEGKGRWVDYSPLSKKCEIPFCSGDREEALISDYSWQGTKYSLVWVPHDCYFHYYSKDDFGYCAKEKGIKWIHVMGDSLSREVVGYLMSTMGIPDTHKFESADQILNSTDVRITFQSWQDIILAGPRTINLDNDDFIRRKDVISDILNFYNLIIENNSTELIDHELHLELTPPELNTPDVFIMNPAMAYVLFRQSFSSYQQFLVDFTDLMKNSFTQRKIKGYWYANPFIHGTAHAGTEHITQTRNHYYSLLTREYVESINMKFLDTTLYTSMRPEESWDGLHYLRGYSQWNGHVSATMVQSILNDLFGDCKGRPKND